MLAEWARGGSPAPAVEVDVTERSDAVGFEAGDGRAAGHGLLVARRGPLCRSL